MPPSLTQNLLVRRPFHQLAMTSQAQNEEEGDSKRSLKRVIKEQKKAIPEARARKSL